MFRTSEGCADGQPYGKHAHSVFIQQDMGADSSGSAINISFGTTENLKLHRRGAIRREEFGQQYLFKATSKRDLDSDDLWACVICQDEPKDHMIMPCTHIMVLG